MLWTTALSSTGEIAYLVCFADIGGDVMESMGTVTKG